MKMKPKKKINRKKTDKKGKQELEASKEEQKREGKAKTKKQLADLDSTLTRLKFKLFLFPFSTTLGSAVLEAAQLGKVSEEALEVLRQVMNRFNATVALKKQQKQMKKKEKEAKEKQTKEEKEEMQKKQKKKDSNSEYAELLELLNEAFITELEETLKQPTAKEASTASGSVGGTTGGGASSGTPVATPIESVGSKALFQPFREALLALDWLFKPVGQLSPSECAASNLAWFGSSLGIQGLAFDASNTCILGIDDDFSLHLTYEPTSEMLYMYSPLFDGHVEDDGRRLQLCEALLEASMLGSKFAGGGVGWDAGAGLILMHCCLNMCRAPRDTLFKFAPLYVETVEKWRSKVREIVGSSAPVDIIGLLKAFAPRTDSSKKKKLSTSVSSSGVFSGALSSSELHDLFSK